MSSIYERLVERYETGQVPWDAELPPPEVMATLAHLPPGRALDLGCGYGRASIYMARQGWQVDGVDFVAQAIDEAERRAEAAGVITAVSFHVHAVTSLPFLTDSYDFALDVGCLHNFDLAQMQAYAGELTRLLRPGGLYLLFAHLRNESDAEDDSWRWIAEDELLAAFAGGFVAERVEHGTTQVGDNPPWRSAWFWLRRKG
ncbi:MAG: class I SAM-dependent methyltransferase [Anaerolineales bacterium]|nr:class I SAM-dependent methyltransferase [Anaerolineales bacterium]